MVVEAYGRKDDRDVLVEIHVNVPGVVESFEGPATAMLS